MKCVILLSCIFCWNFCAVAQRSLTQTFTVIDHAGKILPNTPIVLIESTTKERIAKNTDAKGNAVFTLTTGNEWNVNILKIKNYKRLVIPELGNATGSATIAYDWEYWERTHRKPVDRTKLNLQTVPQVNVDRDKYSNTEGIVDLGFTREGNKPLTNFPVQITCYKLQKIFTATTDMKGHALFRVPISNEYEVDIDGVNSYSFIDMDEHPGESGLNLVYIPTTIKEINKNDTITQVAQKIESGTSGRTFTKFNVTCSDCGKMTDETIYLEDIYSHKVYKAKLDVNGHAEMLLPIKSKYMVHFRYQPDVDVVDLTEVKGISEFTMGLHYQPLPELKYPERNLISPEQFLSQDFKKFFNSVYPTPKDDAPVGMFLKWYNPKANALSKEAVLEIGFTVPDRKQTTNILSSILNVCFVIDVSGSMEGHEKIDRVKSAMLKYIPELRKTDIVSMVTFDDKYVVAVPTQKMGDGAYMRDMIEDLHSGGGTEIYHALEEGYKQVLKNYNPKGVNRVVLLTDGMDSHPVDSTVMMSKKYNTKGVELSCVGVGQGYNHALLSQLASIGGGLLHLTGEAADMDEIFASEMGCILRPVAKNVTVEIEYNNKIVYKQLYGFPTEKKGTNKVVMKLDHVYRGLNTLALVKFDLSNPSQEVENAPVIVRLTYFDAEKNANVTVMEKANLEWSTETGQLELVLEAEKKKMYATAVTNQSVMAMADAFNKGDYIALQKAVDDAKRQLKDLYPASNNKDISALITGMEKYSAAVTKVVKAKAK